MAEPPSDIQVLVSAANTAIMRGDRVSVWIVGNDDLVSGVRDVSQQGGLLRIEVTGATLLLRETALAGFSIERRQG